MRFFLRSFFVTTTKKRGESQNNKQPFDDVVLVVTFRFLFSLLVLTSLAVLQRP